MDQIIVAETLDGRVNILSPTEQALSKYTLMTLGEKDVPEGCPFWILDREDIPKDSIFFAAFELNKEELGEPDGYGMNIHVWMEENL